MHTNKRITFFSIAILSFFGIFFFAHAASAATIYANSATGNDTTGDGTSGTPYKTFHKAYTIANADDTINLTGTFTWTDADETGDAVTSGYTIGKNITIDGNSPTSTIIQAASADNTATARVFTFSSSVSTTFSNLTIRNGKVSSSSGGCVSITTSDVVTFDTVEMYNCRSGSSGYGGGISLYSATTTIINSALYNNVSGASGGGISNSSGKLYITNTTIFSNQVTGGGSGGAGVYSAGASAATYITNSTITRNTGNYGGGINAYSSSNVYLKNSIVANNTGIGNSQKNFYNSSATYTSNGYNVIGHYGSSLGPTATTGDWTDANNDDTYDLYTVGTTGTLQIDTEGGINDSSNGTRTVALLSGGIATNNATTSAHSIVAIPTVDQRGATRNGATDIGSFELAGGGLSIVAPTTQVTSIATTSIAYNQMSISWTNGNGSRRVLFMKEAGSGNASPVDGTKYSASTVFGSGDQIGSSGWYAIYDGISSSSLTITGLSPSTTYSIQGFEYNGVSDGQSVYMTATASGNPLVAPTYVPTTIYANSSTGNDSTGDGTSGAPYKTFHKAYTEAVSGDTLNLTGTFTWTDADETGDAGTSGYTIGKDLTITGQNARDTVIQADSTSNTASARVFTISSNVSTTIQSLTIRYGKVSSSGGCMLINSSATITIDKVEVNNCISTSYGGGLLSYASSFTLSNSAIYSNTSTYSGGGLSVGAGTSNVNNTTVYGNHVSNNPSGGGGVYATGSGTALYLTNVTVTGNYGNYGGGVSSYSSAVIYLKNSFIFDNSGSSGSSNFYRQASASYVSGGYNIIDYFSGTAGPTATTGDWTDANNDATFVLYSVATTGTVNLDTAAANNDNPNYTKTWGILDGSIAINNATTTDHGSFSVPSTDQRTAVRVAGADIGAFEYGGVLDDITSPTVVSFNPTNNATNVGVTSTFEINFDENIVTSTGNIVLYKVSDGSTVETIDITSDLVTASSTTALIIDPSTTLASETEYYFLIDATAIDDSSGNSFAGITATTTWRFTTADVDSPTVSLLSPADNATGVASSTNFIITFDEDIATSTGNISLYTTADDTLVEAIDIASAQVTASGTTALVINPTSDLADGTEYYIIIDATAIDDTAGNSFAGISVSTTWSFTSLDTVSPVISSPLPSGEQSAGVVSVTLSVSTDEIATCKYSATSGTSFASMTAFSSTGATSHTSSVSASDGTSYSYYVLCQDSTTNESSEATISFSVAAAVTPSVSSGGGASIPPAPPSIMTTSPIIPTNEDEYEVYKSGAFVINNNDAQTDQTSVILSFKDIENALQMALSESPDFAGISFIPFTNTNSFILSPVEGLKTVYAKLRSKEGGTITLKDTIRLTPVKEQPADDIENSIEPPINQKQNVQCTSSATPPLTAIRPAGSNNAADVRLLEEFLNTYENANLPINGIYEPADVVAVIRWQEKHAADILAPWGITQGTGHVYTTSLKKIKEIHEANCTPTKEEPIVTPPPTANIASAQCLNTSQSLSFGMNNSLVVTAQQLLKNLGYFPVDIDTTGYFGPITRTAVLEFQAAHNISQVGIVGPQTRAKLNELGCSF